MPKKKTKKNKNEINVSIEVYGLIFIITSVIAIPQWEPLGKYFWNFGVWLFGVYAIVFYSCLLALGVYLVYKSEYPKFFTKRMFGFYLIFIALSLYAHTNFIEMNLTEGKDIIKSTFDEFMLVLNRGDVSTSGAGMFGALISYVLMSLIGGVGTKVFTIFFLFVGISYSFNKNIFEFIRSIFELLNKQKIIVKSGDNKKKKGNGSKNKTEKVEKEISKVEEDFESQNKIVISNFDELRELNKNQQQPTENKEPELIKEEVVINKYDSYQLPPISLLNNPKNKRKNNQHNLFVEQNASLLEETLSEFNVSAKVKAINVGPTVTQYEVEIRRGTKVSRIVNLSKEIALALAAHDVRIQAPIPGKNTIGIEIPNKDQSVVHMKEIMLTKSKKITNPLSIGLGRDILGKPIRVELNTMPHLLVAGATGSGKSVCINSIITSILMQAKPDQVKLLLVDPKKVELNVYNGVPHLLAPVVTDPKKASVALKKIVTEMERRYELFSDASTRNIAGYNKYLELNDEPEKKLPYIVVVIDELADLMMVAKNDVEEAITRITQLARAAGIHLIVATQRPSTDVITGLIKANIPSRIAFGVSRSIDSRVILDTSGAEKLLGKGDMLFLGMGESSPIRIQGTFLSDEEVFRVVNHCVKQQIAVYDENLSNLEVRQQSLDTSDYEEDDLYEDVERFVIESKKASASLLQRRFRIGYNRAARLIDKLESRGVVGPSNGSKPREVLIIIDDSDNQQ